MQVLVAVWQTAPAWQVWFAQQTAPTAPHPGGWQVPLWQVVPSPQVPPAQQGWPTPPQATQIPFWQSPSRLSAPQMSFGQQTCPTWPQGWQVPLVQYNCWAPLVSQVWFGQHGCPWPPQPGARQVPSMQFTPAWQVSSAQHGWPACPHAWQVRLLVQTVPAWQVSPSQQGLPATPQVKQVPFRQRTLELWQGVLPMQQGWSGAPQATQVPLLQIVSESKQPTGFPSWSGQQGVPWEPQICWQLPASLHVLPGWQVLSGWQHGSRLPPHGPHRPLMQTAPELQHT
jgi:hypothetical protein